MRIWRTGKFRKKKKPDLDDDGRNEFWASGRPEFEFVIVTVTEKSGARVLLCPWRGEHKNGIYKYNNNNKIVVDAKNGFSNVRDLRAKGRQK